MLFNKQSKKKSASLEKQIEMRLFFCFFFNLGHDLKSFMLLKKKKKEKWHTLNGIHIFHRLFLVCLLNRLSAPLPSSLCLPYHGVIHLSALFVSPPACTLTFCSVKHYCKAVTRNRCSRPIYSKARVSDSQLRAETDSIRVPGSCVVPLLLLRSLSSGISFLLASLGRRC